MLNQTSYEQDGTIREFGIGYKEYGNSDSYLVSYNNFGILCLILLFCII